FHVTRVQTCALPIYDAVDRRTRTVLPQQVEERQPLQPILGADRVAAGGVEHDALGGEVPVAVARAAKAVDDVAAVVLEREAQTGIEDRGSLAGRGIADVHVPGQLVQRPAAARLADTRGADRADRLCHAFAQQLV